MPNLAPLGCSPITRALNKNNTGACIEGLSALAKLHNEALSKSFAGARKSTRWIQIFNNR